MVVRGRPRIKESLFQYGDLTILPCETCHLPVTRYTSQLRLEKNQKVFCNKVCFGKWLGAKNKRYLPKPSPCCSNAKIWRVKGKWVCDNCSRKY